MDTDFMISTLGRIRRNGKIIEPHIVNGQKHVEMKGGLILLSDYLYATYYGTIPEDKKVIHINGDPLDCRLANLKLANLTDNRGGPCSTSY